MEVAGLGLTHGELALYLLDLVALGVALMLLRRAR